MTYARASCLAGLPIALALTASVAVAQQAADTARLAPVVVTATRVRVPENSAPTSVTVITGNELRARGITTVAEALRSVPGAEVAQSGSFGATTSLFLRGGESDYVKVLVDGVPVNDPGGAFDFAQLTTDNVDRIEIVRGPASVLYGSDAMTGVIQIFTRRGAGPSRAAASVRGGTYETRDYDATVLGAGGALQYSLSAARHTTAGILPFNNQDRDNTYSGSFRLAPSARSELRASLRYTDADFHYPTNSAGVPEDSNAFNATKRFVADVEAGHFFTSRVEGRVLLANTTIDDHSDDRPDNAGDTLGFYGYLSSSRLYRRSVDARVNVYLTPLTVVTAGAEYAKQHDASSSLSMSQYGNSASPPFDRSRENTAYYAQLVGNAGHLLSYTLGGRVDDNQRFGTFATYRAGIGVHILADTRLHLSAGSAFKEPTFDEQFATGFAQGNPALNPERSRSWEFGAEQRLFSGRLTLAATYFDQRFRDLVQYASMPPGQPDYFNVAAANASGVELEARLPAIARVLGVTANYTYLHTRVIDAGFDSTADALFVQGNRLLRRPTHLASVHLDYRTPRRALLGATVSYVGRRDDRDFSSFPATPVELPAYTKVDISAELPLVTHRVADHALALTARIDNLFNAQYQGVYGFRVPGRVVLLGARAGVGL
ncbi:MAG TPA: TonB-dependent receptor [Gemmatimonadaceae bacterium]